LSSDTSKLIYALFKELKELFEFEWHRMEKLDEKAIHIATSTGTILTIFTVLATFSLKEIDVSSDYFSYASILILLILSLFIPAILISLFSIKTKSYKIANPELLIEEYANRTMDEFVEFYGGDIIDTINSNKKINDKKAANIDLAAKLLGGGIFSIIFYIILIIIYMSN